MRTRTSLDKGWRFALGHAADDRSDFGFRRTRSMVKAGEERGAGSPAFDDSAWQQVDIPHDWALDLPYVEGDQREHVEHGFKPVGPDHPQTSVGWYRRAFDLTPDDLGKRISITFDGVFRDSVVFVNGHWLGRHMSGYTPFTYDLTDYLRYGLANESAAPTVALPGVVPHKADELPPGRNVIAVRVDASSHEGWWYEGAGIYRHVWLLKTDPLHVARDGVVIRSELTDDFSRARVSIVTTVANQSDSPRRLTVSHSARDDDGAVVGRDEMPLEIGAWQSVEIERRIDIASPRLWSCDSPHLYRLTTALIEAGVARDNVDTVFGVRTIRWDAQRGFFLNGQHVVIKGTCNHHVHAGVGVAMPDRLHEWRLERLKEMGANAYRCSHYMAAPELLDCCDRMGILVMAENRQVGSTPDMLGQWEAMIRRDRNHPSIILWSMANEEHTIQWSLAGERLGASLVRAAKRLDPTRAVTSAMHDRGLGAGLANVVDVHGWNYISVGDIDAYHRLRPDRPIIGSEEGSTVCTRGEYEDDAERGYVSAYDRRAPKWGSTAERWWTFFMQRPWLAGGFVWTGFDYRGEPIPYKWPCTASHFGLMDLCGFPKDNYWYYRAWWRPEPVCHLLPHWNWPGREGQPIDVRCLTNAAAVELYLNGVSQGRREVPRYSHAAWQVPYQPGRLDARATDARGAVVASASVETAGPASALRARVDRTTLRADASDIAVVMIDVIDERGRVVPTAGNTIDFALAGPLRLLGVGNGDPSSHEPDHAPHRRAFNGHCFAIVQSTAKAGRASLTLSSPGLRAAVEQLTTA